MLPVALLMPEHRPIERMIPVVREEMDLREMEGNITPEFIDPVVDFIRR
jgi:hemerythrin-like domain-containing protein